MPGKSYYIQLDINKDYDQLIGIVKQNDIGVVLKANLISNSKPLDLSPYSYVTCTVQKPDQSFVNGYCEILDSLNGKIEFALPITVTDSIGEYRGEIQIYEGINSISTASFTYVVKESLLRNEGVSDQPEYPILNQLISETTTLKTSYENIAVTEETRISSETSRVSSELTRVSNENVRIATEEDRLISESQRKSNEINRVNAESSRVGIEQNRVDNEASRLSAESSRVSNETIRISSENSRIADEDIRRGNEIVRVSNETYRQGKESERDNSEGTRSTNENHRVAQESDRHNSETVRVASELQRESNEADRQNSELIRQTYEGQRVSAEVLRNQTINDKLSLMNTTMDYASNVVLKMPTDTTTDFDDDGRLVKVTYTYDGFTESLEILQRADNGLAYEIEEKVIDGNSTIKTYRHYLYYTTFIDEESNQATFVVSKVTTREVS